MSEVTYGKHHAHSYGGLTAWNEWQKVIFRFFFIYFLVLALPLDPKFYVQLFSINWSELNFYDLLNLTRYSPRFFSDASIPQWGIGSFANWGIAALLAFAGAIAWSVTDRNREEYNQLYYWLRVILRYRLAIGIIAYGIIKLFPLQMPYPSLSNLHTNYGDFYAWKIYYLTFGISPKYETFMGVVEIVSGLLLFSRRTTTFGAGIILGFIGNVVAANFAYQIGEHVYASYLLSIALFLFVYDVPRLYNLLINKKFTKAVRFHPSYSAGLHRLRNVLKIGAVLFILVFGIKTYANYLRGPYLFPGTQGLSNAYGFYDVQEFSINNKSIPYSLTDSTRWQDVVFEKWATISIRVTGNIKPDPSRPDQYHTDDLKRNYESAGVTGRKYYAYETDTLKHQLILKNKNPNYANEQLVLNYSRPDSTRIILTGINEKNDSLSVVLQRVIKKYMMLEGRRKPIKL